MRYPMVDAGEPEVLLPIGSRTMSSTLPTREKQMGGRYMWVQGLGNQEAFGTGMYFMAAVQFAICRRVGGP